jgi:drug/metabolite transporter (DMT)-like permease
VKNSSSVIVQPREALSLGLLAVLGFSGTMPATRVAVRELDPTFVALARAVGAGVIAAGFLLARRERWPLAHQLRSLAIVALGIVIVFPLLSAWSLTSVPASEGAMVLAFTPTLTAMFGLLQRGERPALSFWLANGLGLAAVLWFLQGGSRSFGQGHAVMFVAAVVCAIGYTEGARLAREMSGLAVVSWALVLSLPLLAPMLLLRLPPTDAVHAPAWLGLAYITIISMFVAFVPWYAAMARGGIALTAQIQLLQPLLSVLWASLLLGEPLSARLWLTLAIVLGSIYLARRLGHAPKPPMLQRDSWARRELTPPLALPPSRR